MAGYFSGILLRCSIYLIEMVYDYVFCSTSLSSGVPSLLVVLVLIFIHDTPANFYLGCRKRRRLTLSLGVLIVRRVCILLSS